ncbi:hypothetical protein Plec18167_007166 [Paecilomyces lecythidis]|uniref:Sulphur transport domain-containing protein n=1 Tax=Paecilomyces lecythidis TaxID=3004212 RepID=A0ABR3X5M7_9EURO
MSSNLFPAGIAGSLFGTALTLTGVYNSSVITAQLRLEDFHTLKVFLAASSSSVLAISLYEKLSRRELSRRPQSSLSLICPYDGNIIGGAMLGIGMAMTGACPGSIPIQFTLGMPSGRYLLMGGVLGGITYAFLARTLGKSCRSEQAQTLPKKLGISPNAAVLMFEAMAVSMIMVARSLHSSGKSFFDPTVAGLIVGATQLATLILTKAPIGVSTFYEDIGNWFWDCLGYKDKGSTKPLFPMSRAIAFVGGIMVSSLILPRVVPEAIFRESLDISPLKSILGAMVMILGARTAGGCTSGHGISGMSMMGISSFITIASVFAGGIGFLSVM